MPQPTALLPLDDRLAPANGNIIELVTSAVLPCQQQDAALWFSSVPAELNLAKGYCRGCRNRQPCLAGALERGEPWGVWGGEIFERGRIVKFKRPRGRPRKSQSPASA